MPNKKTKERKLRKGDHVVVYEDPDNATTVEAVGVLHGFNGHHPTTYGRRKLESWSVRFTATGPVRDRWVCVRDLQL